MARQLVDFVRVRSCADGFEPKLNTELFGISVRSCADGFEHQFSQLKI